MIEYQGIRDMDTRRKLLVPPPPARSVWLWVLSGLMWTCAGVVIFFMLMAALSFGVGLYGTVGFMSPALALIVLTAIAAFMRSRRRSHAQRMLNYLHQAVRLNLPLPAMLHAAQLGERGRMAARLRRLGRQLEDGLPLGRALEVAAADAPRRAVATLEAAEHTGQIGPALERLTAGPGDDEERLGSRIHLRWYPLVMFLFVGGAINLFMIFVVPKYEAIFSDFRLPLPPVTRNMIELWRVIGIPLTLCMLVVLLVYCGRSVARAIAPRWAAAGAGWIVWDRVVWALPVVRAVVQARGLADAFHVAADALAAGATLPAALEVASRVPGNIVLRGRFSRWATGIVTGTPASEAAARAKMPELVRGMVGTGVASSQLADVFRFLARYYEARVNRMSALLEGAAVPAVSLFFGVVVGAVVLGVMLPLVRLIHGLLDQGLQ